MVGDRFGAPFSREAAAGFIQFDGRNLGLRSYIKLGNFGSAVMFGSDHHCRFMCLRRIADFADIHLECRDDVWLFGWSSTVQNVNVCFVRKKAVDTCQKNLPRRRGRGEHVWSRVLHAIPVIGVYHLSKAGIGEFGCTLLCGVGGGRSFWRVSARDVQSNHVFRLLPCWSDHCGKSLPPVYR